MGDTSEVKNDPKEKCKQLIEDLETKLTDNQAQQAGHSLEYLSEVEKRVDKWVNGETHIYSTIMKTLKNQPADLIVCAEGAGRAALTLTSVHKTGDKTTTKTWIYLHLGKLDCAAR